MLRQCANAAPMCANRRVARLAYMRQQRAEQGRAVGGFRSRVLCLAEGASFKTSASARFADGGGRKPTNWPTEGAA